MGSKTQSYVCKFSNNYMIGRYVRMRNGIEWKVCKGMCQDVCASKNKVYIYKFSICDTGLYFFVVKVSVSYCEVTILDLV